MAQRKPAQEDLAYDDIAAAEEAIPTKDVVNSNPMDIIGEFDKNQKPSESSGVDSRTAQSIGRMVAGATPTLFGMLFGPQQAERGIAATQKFNAAGKPSKLVPVIGPDGSPIYETPEAAVGEKFYQRPLRPSAAGLPQKTEFYNPETKRVEKGWADPIAKKYYNAAMQEVPNAQQYIPTEFKEASTAGGTKQFIPVSPVSGGQAGPVISGPPGEAAAKGLGSEQYKAGLDISKQFPKEIAPLQQKIEYANASLKLLSSPDKATQAEGLKQAQQYLQDAKTNGAGINIAMPPGFFDKWTEVAYRAATGKASAGEVNGLMAAIQQTASAQHSAILSMGKASSIAAGPEAQPMLNKSIYNPPSYTPTMPKVPPSQHPQTSTMIKKASDILANPNSSEEDKNNAKKILKINKRL